MMNHPLKKLDKKRLRRWLLLFFLALLIPTVLLVQQSYSRLKWETFHQHQLMAAELSERIDQRLMQLISNENQRVFDDFSFLKTSSDSKARVAQRSALAEFPVAALPPGLLGHFQVDASGQLLTPIVPVGNAESYGIPELELSERIALQNKIQEILLANRLIQKSKLSTKPSVSFDEVFQDVASDAAVGAMLGRSTLSEADVQGSKMEAEALSFEQAPIAFDQLKDAREKSVQSNEYSRVEDLQIKQNYLQKEVEEKRQASSRKLKKASPPKAATAREAVRKRAMRPRIRTFESEVDPFEFSLLDSTYFVLFRQVWRNGQRYTQGLLIEQSAFLEEVINAPFAQTTLSGMSDLLVVYQGNVIRPFYGKQAANSRIKSQKITEQQLGEQLYQVRLSDPLSDLQLIYSITQLPIGSGGRLILWLALILGAVLFGGFYLMYRLGLSQINLANQQQDFVSAVSHELKTPLTSIRMYGEMLIQGWATEDKKKTYYQFIFDESERLSRLINNVLQLARMTRNEQKAELAVCNVPDLVKEITSKISSQIEVADFALQVNSDEELATAEVMIDSDWLIQVMINLVDNAIKFSAKAEKKVIILDVQRSTAQQVSFTISDFGPGIDEQQMKKIFGLFYRSENELTRDTVGTGIGLSLVHQMTLAMGGKVSVANRELAGEFPGAAFCVMFPIIK